MRRLIFLVFFIQLGLALNASTPEQNPCVPSPCEESQRCHVVISSQHATSQSFLCLDPGYQEGTCSLNSYLSCDPYASCLQSSDGQSFTCRCQNGTQGDGFRPEVQGTGCRFPFKPCSLDSDCPEFGNCDSSSFKCRCKQGFQGDGNSCTDINECETHPCHPHATCQNSPGNFTCTCDALHSFVGDGFTCVFFCSNDEDCDVPRAKCDGENKCQCNQGYHGDGLNCTDIDECTLPGASKCSPEADCINNLGSYTCRCRNGYTGDGFNCTERPRRCDQIPNFTPGQTYVIDPDFTGPANSFEVRCDIIDGVKVTIAAPTNIFPLEVPHNDSSLTINYGASPADLQALANDAVFCSQNISFSCSPGFALFPGTSWTDARGVNHQNWGSFLDQKCACGEVGACSSSCFCDGSQTQSSTTDSGQLVDKSSMPVVSVRFSQAQTNKGRVNIGSFMCAQSLFNVPKDCHEAKFKYNVLKNTPLYIDLDGSRQLPPVQVFCNQESFPHVGITSIAPTRTRISPDSPRGELVLYNVQHAVIRVLLASSFFCSQEVEFLCQNSPLSAEGGYVNVTESSQRLNYFPGAGGTRDSCGCGATNSCEEPGLGCNCDIQDGLERTDFGLIINKEHLPVTGVTAVVGPNRRGAYVLGSLQCSQKQFGIEPNCEKYRATLENPRNYTYWVDPDGSGGIAPFLVECRFLRSPPQGQTIVHHTKEAFLTITEETWLLTYLQVSDSQLTALKNRSTICTQEVEISCKQFSIQNGNDAVQWFTADSNKYRLPQYLDTCGQDGTECNCNSQVATSSDRGILSDIQKLPIRSLDFSAVLKQLRNGGELKVHVGPLICEEVFSTCALLKDFLNSGKAVEGEATVVDGRFTIDPDGAGGMQGFEVTCKFPTTIINVENSVGGLNPDHDNSGPVSTCFNITYKNDNGDIISAEQVDALVQKSGKCRQDLTLECQNAPATGKVNFTTCSGQPQKGWAGSFGQDTCACGVNGNCAGGSQASCNCDMADDVARSDSGILINKTQLPVCQICFSIDPITPAPGSSGPTSVLKYKLGTLQCDTDQGTKLNCQDARQNLGTSVRTVQETAVAVSGDAPFPVGCRLNPNPPFGVLVVKVSNPVHPPSSASRTNITITYITLSIRLITKSFQSNEYCSQNIFLFNASSQNLLLGGSWGFFTFDGGVANSWLELNASNKYVLKACQDNLDLCTRFGLPRGFSFRNKGELPITRVLLSAGGFFVVVGDVECLDLKKSCQHIINSGSRTVGLVGGRRFVIDADGPEDIDPFVVNCYFDEVNQNGVTEVTTSGPWASEVVVTGKLPPASWSLAVEYNNVSYVQIRALTQVSSFCWQSMVYTCRSSPLVNRTQPPSSYYDLYGYPTALSFGTALEVDFRGCACAQTGSCMSSGYSCNCDTLAPLAFDQGSVTRKDVLPITKFYVGGQSNSRSSAKIKVTNLRCSSLPIDPPRDCADALNIKSQFGVSYDYDGEYLISPNPKIVEPFMAWCDFNVNPTGGVTVVKVVENVIQLNKSSPVINITYHIPSLNQLRALINQSKYCYQGLKFNCFSTVLFSQGGYWLSAGSTTRHTFWGGGQPRSSGLGLCACGKDQNCGGLDSSNGQRTRACNCEVGDNSSRGDAGIISQKEFLPITQFFIGNNALFTNASLFIGDLYCSQDPINFNECELGYHDCHPLATCVKQVVGYGCVCPEGWRGKGVVVNSNQPRANGRECIDDNECVASKPCPYSAVCINTPGDFECVCKPGYVKTGKTTCEDINECLNSTLNDCDKNARCENLDGSYRCACLRGYRGDGRSCIPVGECVCFGDPHCISYDNRWLHHQDTCSYVLSQDGCRPGQNQTFRVEITTWKKNMFGTGYFSYVKSVKVLAFGKEIRLEQGNQVIVDGRVVKEYFDEHRLSVTIVNNQVILKTVSELLVSWDGKDVVQVTVPKTAKDSVCGLCGNYNGDPADDLTMGPACSGASGQITSNDEQFAQSWVVQNGTCSPKCDQPQPIPEECPFPRAISERECNKLFDSNTSPFKDCLKLKTENEIKEWRNSCIFDVCRSENPTTETCRYGEILAWDCTEQERVEVNNWRSKVSCGGMHCPNNLVYKPCSNSIQKTCLSLNQTSAQSSDQRSCSEGCFCEGNLLLEGDRCVPQEQCGCFYDNGYLARGDDLVLPNCTGRVMCLGNNQTIVDPILCVQPRECRLQDGLLGCYCQDGYLDSDVVGVCTPDPCYNVTCEGPNMVCLSEIQSCVCKAGYIGDCSQCEDIDECATGTSGCNLTGQTCLNTDGSSRCVCEPGFIGNGYNCKDIDECDYKLANCGANSQCVNIPGSFMCECCAGYSKSKSGDCVRNTSESAVSSKCCACQGAKCAESGKVCGTDGKTYASFRSLSQAACLKGDDQLKVNYKGPCQATCETVTCNKQHSTCEMVGGRPVCQCPTCSDSTSVYEDVTVCATNKVTFISQCHMEAATCNAEIETKVEVEVKGRPCPGDGPALVGPWGAWGPCSENCKQGVQVRTRDVYINSSALYIHSQETIPCYSTCEQGPCQQDTCAEPGQVCVAGEDNVPSCECPECGDDDHDLICGRLGYVIQTYLSACELNRTACEQREPDFEVLEPRACEDKPVMCGLIRKYEVVVDENGCVADQSINFGECYGGCDQEAELCCYGNQMAEKKAIMYCPDGSSFEKFFEVITECSCATKADVEALKMKVVP